MEFTFRNNGSSSFPSSTKAEFADNRSQNFMYWISEGSVACCARGISKWCRAGLGITEEEWGQYQFEEHLWADSSSYCNLEKPHSHCREASCRWCWSWCPSMTILFSAFSSWALICLPLSIRGIGSATLLPSYFDLKSQDHIGWLFFCYTLWWSLYVLN